MACKGMDASVYNGTIDWERAREAGIEFTILRVVDRELEPDPRFETYYRDALEAGVEIQGVYNYSYATSVSKARSDAEKIIRILGRRKHMVWLDIETEHQMRLSNEELLRIVRAAEEVYRRAGIIMGVYTGLYFYDEKFRPLAEEYRDIPFWIAEYPREERMEVREDPDHRDRPRIANKLYGWQYTDNGSVPGVQASSTDLDLWYAHIDGREHDCDFCDCEED